MNKLLITFLLVSNSLLAQIVFENTLTNTFDKAKNENKAVFIEFYNETCHHCQKVQPLLASTEVSNVYNPIFVSYKINTYKGLTKEEQDFLEKHKLFFTDVPNFIYFDKNEQFLHHSSGKPDVSYIIAQSKDAFDPKKQTSQLGNRIKNGENSLANLYQYSLLAQLNQNKPLADSIANTLYRTFDKKNLGNDTSYTILKNAVFSTKNGFFEFWLNNQNKLKNMDTGEFKGQEIDLLKNIITIDISDPNYKWTKQAIDDIYSKMVATNYTSKPENILVTKRIELFDPKNPSKDVVKYLDPIMTSEVYDLDDKFYILNTVNENFTDKKTKKTISKYVTELKKKAEAQKNTEFVNQLNKI